MISRIDVELALNQLQTSQTEISVIRLKIFFNIIVISLTQHDLAIPLNELEMSTIQRVISLTDFQISLLLSI